MSSAAHRSLIDTDYPLDETLERSVELVEWIEDRARARGDGKLEYHAHTLAAHIRVLRDDFNLTEQPS